MLRAFTSKLREFHTSCSGVVAIIYAAALIPLVLAVCGGLDYARAVMVRAAMTEALDAAALALGATKNLSDADAQALVNQYFKANYHITGDYGTPGGANGAFTVDIVRSGQSIALTISDQMPTTVLRIIPGFDTWTVKASSTVVWGQLKLWVSLVLDNTGSMSQTDSSGLSKISALKTASHQLLTMLQGAVTTDGDVKVAIIPFTRTVNIGTTTPYPTWLTFSDFTAAPTTPSTSYGPGTACPWTTSTNGYQCTTGPANGSSTTSKIPSSGTYKGYICPSVTGSAHYWNGCFNSVLVSGTTNKWNHTWIPNSTSTWTGCVTDRGLASGPSQDYDVSNSSPTVTNPVSLMVAENSPSCVGTTLMPLTSAWTNLSAKIDQMVANGSTNQTIGLVWGWHALSQGAPLTPGALPDATQRIIILLSDGLNTQDRWYGDGSSQSASVDSRMALACKNAKADGVIIYAVYVDIAGTQGNSSVLQQCATDTSKYFDLTSSSQIVAAFNTIGQQITNLRVSQ